jgi:transcriptional regulator with XRE-family HTH domain
MVTHSRRRRRSSHDLRLKIAIIESRRTQRQIALDTRIGEVRLSKLIMRTEQPTPEEQARLARYLNRAVAELFDVVDDENEEPSADDSIPA